MEPWVIFISLIFFLLLTLLNPRRKGIKTWLKRIFFLKKSAKSVHVCGMLLTIHFGSNNQIPITYALPRKSRGHEKIGASQWSMVSYGL